VGRAAVDGGLNQADEGIAVPAGEVGNLGEVHASRAEMAASTTRTAGSLGVELGERRHPQDPSHTARASALRRTASASSARASSRAVWSRATSARALRPSPAWARADSSWRASGATRFWSALIFTGSRSTLATSTAMAGKRWPVACPRSSLAATKASLWPRPILPSE
jgi:hypothetical protein